MAPNLRSSSHARSANSRPSTPLDAPVAAGTASSFHECTRPRKQRRIGRNTRVATDPPQGSLSQNHWQPERPSTGTTDIANGLQLPGETSGWVEPPVRTPAPSYADTPWSAVSSDANPVLATMRPLGSMPSAADLRKVGIVPSKPNNTQAPVTKELQTVLNGEQDTEKSQTPLTPAEEQIVEPTPPKLVSDEEIAALMALPLPDSLDFDPERAKAAVENALHIASETHNHKVIRGLFHLWEKSTKDSFLLSVIDGMCQENPGPHEKDAFQIVMRAAWREVRDQENPDLAPDAPPAMTRTESASSVSSLSSAKSLDVETSTPGVTPGLSTTRSRAKGKQAKAAPQKPKDKEISEPPARRSAFPSNDAATQRKRALESDPEFSAEAVNAKRTRLRKNLPHIVAQESKLRSSLASYPASNVSSPGPTSAPRLQLANGATVNGRERSESPASSDAGDNRRLTPSFTEETLENNDFCRNCGRNGQLLCCDGCVNSFHFSCLDPPLDPANPPEGEWFCPKCSFSRPMRQLLDRLDNVGQKDFALPFQIRDFFTGIKTGEGGRYEEVAPLPRLINRGGRGNRTGRYDDPYLLRTMDGKGKLIFCYGCGRTTNGRRPIIQCDYCPCAWHMDCVDPPLANPPSQRPGSERVHQNWMCPNHVYHDLFYVVKDEEGYDAIRRIRHPKRPRMIDIEILPDVEESEKIENQMEEGIMYRVSEKGVKLDFIERVKRENEEAAMKKAAADKYFGYAKTKFDDLVSKAHSFYSSQKPVFPEEDTTTAIVNSRTVAEREAAANLIAFAQNNQLSMRVENGRINLLIDQLKANAPSNLPKPETEIASLRTLQDLIEQRIQVLNSQSMSEPVST